MCDTIKVRMRKKFRVITCCSIFLGLGLSTASAQDGLSWSTGNLLELPIPLISESSAGWLVQMYMTTNANLLLANVMFQSDGAPLGGGSEGDERLVNFFTYLSFEDLFGPVVDFNASFLNFSEIKEQKVYTVILDAPSWEEAIPGVSQTFVLDQMPAAISVSAPQNYTVPHTNPGNHSWQIVQGSAAQGTESFATGPAGWQFGVDPDSAWSWTNGAVRLAFDAIGAPAARSSSLIGGGTASGSQFVGDYAAAGVQLIGFEFYPDDALPDSLTITLSADGAGVVSDVTGRATTPGTWNQIAVPVTANAAPFWQSVNGGQLSTILANVQEFRIDVGVATAAAQNYRIRNIFLGLVPVAAEIQPQPTASPEITWDNLRTNWTYRVDVSSNLVDQIWTSAGQFTATNSVTGFISQTNEHLQIYRLIIE